ncbi:hypothetical protein ASG29_13410 [Sphingomonas sp. Leaf412]|nr:hypothetical protein ASG29_13410 [Sphingomonas sp. Leaf412]
MTTATIDKSRLRWLKESDAPIRSWQVTAVEDRNGVPLIGNDSGPTINPLTSVSRLVATTREAMVKSIVVLDVGSMDGKTVRQIADITTLHLLLNIAPDAGDRSVESILALFDRSVAPQEMTPFDRGLLAGLYTPPTNAVTAGETRRRIRRTLTRGRGYAADQK